MPEKRIGTLQAVNPALLYPFMASLDIVRGGNAPIAGGYRCGGTLVSPTVVLTAAHCLQSSSANPLTSITVLLGASPSQMTFDAPRRAAQLLAACPNYNPLITDRAGWNDLNNYFGQTMAEPHAEAILAATWKQHELFNIQTVANDIGLIFLSRASLLQPVALDLSGIVSRKGLATLALGFGSLNPDNGSSEASVLLPHVRGPPGSPPAASRCAVPSALLARCCTRPSCRSWTTLSARKSGVPTSSTPTRSCAPETTPAALTPARATPAARWSATRPA